MSANTVSDFVALMETLPSEMQVQVVEHLQEYLAELRDEQRWDAAFERTQSSLVAAARKARQARAAGQAQTMDYEQL